MTPYAAAIPGSILPKRDLKCSISMGEPANNFYLYRISFFLDSIPFGFDASQKNVDTLSDNALNPVDSGYSKVPFWRES